MSLYKGGVIKNTLLSFEAKENPLVGDLMGDLETSPLGDADLGGERGAAPRTGAAISFYFTVKNMLEEIRSEPTAVYMKPTILDEFSTTHQNANL